MKIVHTSDWHIGKIVNDFSMLEDQRYFLQQLTLFLKQKKIDVLIVAGDIYDRSVPPAEAVSLVNDTLVNIVQHLNIPVILISGNHDSPQRLSFAHSLLEQSGLFICGEVQRPLKKVTISDHYGPVNFYLLPYFQLHDIKRLYPEKHPATINDAFELIKQEIQEEWNQKERNVFIAHGFFSAQEEQIAFPLRPDLSIGMSERISSDLFSLFDYTALGHIHRSQTIGIPTARYSGSPLKYSIDEAAHQKSITMITLNKKENVKIEQLPIEPFHDLRIISGTFDQLFNRNRPENGNLNDYIFAHLEESHPIMDAISKLRGVFPNIIGLSYTKQGHQTTSGLFQAQKIKEKEPLALLEEFYSEISGTNLSQEQKELSESIFKKIREYQSEVE